jgi:TetR/AcrR family transcriptional repressor of nem operon
MPRIREFDPNTVLDAALDLFWRKGYKACSMDDVVKKSGVARYGLYQAFKDKDQLYCAALKRYLQKISTTVFKPFSRNAELADFETLVEYFEQMLAQLEKGGYKGCFIHQAAIERADKDANVDSIVQAHFTQAQGRYCKLLERSIEKGQVRNIPIDDLALYIIGIQRAVVVMSKQNCSHEACRQYVHCALELLRP